jgi:choline kinase
MEEYKVLITTSGIGSRLGNLTNFTNKCLVRIGKKPAISYIIELYPEDIEIVITLGYFGNQVKDFLTLAYPSRKFKFIIVDKFEGEGSSLGYSILKAKDELQCPFIFHAADTIITEKIQAPIKNWLGAQFKENNSQYRTISYISSRMINEKGDLNSKFAYIGLAGINDYQLFWDSLTEEYESNVNDTSLSDCHAINKMNVKWEVIEYFKWLDIGNVSELKHAREVIHDKFELLDKVDESIFLFDNFVIKFFYNKKICENRIQRCQELSGLTPKLLAYRDNFYKYEYAVGDLLANVVNEIIFDNFLDWSKKNLWIKNGKSEEFKKITKEFYFDKTYKRLEKLFNNNKIDDTPILINGLMVPSAIDMLKQIDVNWLCSEYFYQFHGDYILDNIIYKNKSEFVLLDWRQDFGGNLKNGDIYYDLAKLNHNLVFNHDIVRKGLYLVNKSENTVRCDILRSDILTNCREKLHKWVIDNDLDLQKVQILTAIIWLNMAPLHEHKMGEFLYYFGRFNLYKNLYL